jgi:hypothetical protein
VDEFEQDSQPTGHPPTCAVHDNSVICAILVTDSTPVVDEFGVLDGTGGVGVVVVIAIGGDVEVTLISGAMNDGVLVDDTTGGCVDVLAVIVETIVMLPKYG